MSEDAIGAAFAVIVGLVVGISHLMAARDPERNSITRLINDYYDHTGNLPNSQAMFLVGIGALLCSLLGLGGFVYELLR